MGNSFFSTCLSGNVNYQEMNCKNIFVIKYIVCAEVNVASNMTTLKRNPLNVTNQR